MPTSNDWAPIIALEIVGLLFLRVTVFSISESTGEPIGPGMAFVRDICHILDSLACYIGWLFPIWDAKRQTFADKIVSTIVIPV